MDCKNYKFTRHAVQQMFARSITVEMVKKVIQEGKLIENYPEDKPYSSILMLGFYKSEPIHVVVAVDKKDFTCIVITTYVPDANKWNGDFNKRINS